MPQGPASGTLVGTCLVGKVAPGFPGNTALGLPLQMSEHFKAAGIDKLGIAKLIGRCALLIRSAVSCHCLQLPCALLQLQPVLLHPACRPEVLK
jgi:hypothetical protein